MYAYPRFEYGYGCVMYGCGAGAVACARYQGVEYVVIVLTDVNL